jgi:hypothetical protein
MPANNKDLSRFINELDSKLNYLDFDFPENLTKQFRDDITTCLRELHNAYEINADLLPKTELHVRLHNLLYKLKCRYVQQYLLSQNSEQHNQDLQQMIVAAFVNAVPEQLRAEAQREIQKFVESNCKNYVAKFLEKVAADTYNLYTIFDILRHNIVAKVADEIPILAGYDVYAIFDVNLQHGFNHMCAVISANTSVDNIDGLVKKHLPGTYRFDNPGDQDLAGSDPCSFFNYIKTVIEANATSFFNPIAIRGAFANLLKQAQKHQDFLKQANPAMPATERHLYIKANQQGLQLKRSAIEKWAGNQACALITGFFTQYNLEQYLALYIQHQGGKLQIELKNFLIVTAEQQLSSYYVLPEFLRTAPTRPAATSKSVQQLHG